MKVIHFHSNVRVQMFSPLKAKIIIIIRKRRSAKTSFNDMPYTNSDVPFAVDVVFFSIIEFTVALFLC